MVTVRKQILLSAAQNERLRKLKEATGISESEIVRRALEAYDPNGGGSTEIDNEVRETLAALVEQNTKAAQALETAEAEITATEKYLRQLRTERGAAARPEAKRGRRTRNSAPRKSRPRKAAGGR